MPLKKKPAPKKKVRGVPKKPAFLQAFVRSASITKAARACRLADRTMHYRWLREDAEYAVAFAQAKEAAAGLLEDEAIRRAHEGVRKPVYYQGEVVGHVLEYANDLMMFLLKGMKPETYRERSAVEVSGLGGGPIALKNEKLALLSDDELSALIATAKKIGGEA